jgi:ferredoxin-NADP reductase
MTVTKSLDLLVRAMRLETPGVMSVELTAADGADLPSYEPGAHVDLYLGDGIVRQYSLASDPGNLEFYRLGIRMLPGGQASGYVRGRLRVGDVIKASWPRNNFPLVAAPSYVFIAGGIGITPLLPMMRAASEKKANWSLLYCNRRRGDAPFLSEIRSLGGAVSLHSTEAGTRLDVGKHLAEVRQDTLVYCCGPESLMNAVENATREWPSESVRFEWFTPKKRPEEEFKEGFEIVCEKSGVTLMVPPDRSVLEVLSAAGIEVTSSCEQGICGSCEVRVVAGEVDHRDSILSEAERNAGRTMMVCVSRAKGTQLTLDI